MMNRNTRKCHSQGFSLLEVLIGILIFSLGIMALASLQGSLARNSGDSNARTVAINIAEERIEQMRRFRQVGPSVDPDVATFAGIATGTATETVGQIDYTVTTVVTPYFYDYDSGTFGTTNTDSSLYGDMKLVQVTVTWNDGQEFRVDETTTTSGQLGSGSITLSDVISSIASPAGGKVLLANQGSSSYSPPVDYNPGENPDIISIELGHNKFKESTTPLPDVLRSNDRANDLIETRFDVVTYSQSDDGATFLRREEFRAVACECTLRIPSGETEGGLRPTVWGGTEYLEGEFVSKPYGEVANNQQSPLCDTCCRDHHDGGTGANDDPFDPGRSKYNPFRSPSGYYDSSDPAVQGDHRHYSRDGRTGVLTPATADGDDYYEACRLIRKDGFWRVAQDLRQEGLNAFPADFLDEPGEIDVYSGYVTAAVTAYEHATHDSDLAPTNAYEQGSLVLLTRPEDMPSPILFPAASAGDPMEMITGGVTEQQLRSRGIYIDYLEDGLREKIRCLEIGSSAESCGVPNVTSVLEIVPFYDVQLTWLARWTELPEGSPIEVSNDPIADDNSHSRGYAVRSGYGFSTINSETHKGNLGLTGTDPIDDLYFSEISHAYLYAVSVGGSGQSLSNITISGNITSYLNSVKAQDVVITGDGASCNVANASYTCTLHYPVPSNPRITVSNYFKPNQGMLAISPVLQVNGTEHGSCDSADQTWTRFNLPKTTTSGAHIDLKPDSC